MWAIFSWKDNRLLFGKRILAVRIDFRSGASWENKGRFFFAERDICYRRFRRRQQRNVTLAINRVSIKITKTNSWKKITASLGTLTIRKEVIFVIWRKNSVINFESRVYKRFVVLRQIYGSRKRIFMRVSFIIFLILKL